MANERRLPNYRKMYPTASEEVIAVLRQSERQLQYQDYDLKVERFVLDKTKQVAFFIPSKEDSLERLIEAEAQFEDEKTNVEETAIQTVMTEKLKESLEYLSAADVDLIVALYYEEKTVRQLSQETGVPVMTIQDRKVKVLKKLKKILEN